MKTKTLDAIEMKRRGAEKIYEQLAQMTPAQQLSFWQGRTLALQARQQTTRAKQSAAISLYGAGL